MILKISKKTTMKKILDSILIAGLTLALAACQKVEENVVNIFGDGLKVTATIASFDGTKVCYTFESDAKSSIKPTWSEGDEIIGFDDKGGTFSFTVSAVDTESSKATFDVNDEYTPEDGTVLYGVYYPGRTVADFVNGELAVDITSQSGILGDETPVIMCATAKVSDGAISFEFVNQTAIVGLYKMQIKEGDTPVSAGIQVSGVSLSGVCAKGTIKVDGGKLKLVPGDETETISASGLNLTTVENGFIEVAPASIAPYFSVIPGESTMSIEASTATETYCNVSVIAPAEIVAGNYYYIGKVLGEPVASVTIGSVTTYYASFDAAIAAALAVDEVSIKLLQDCELSAAVNVENKLAINLNGKGIHQIQGNRFIVNNADAVFTIDDSSDWATGRIYNSSTGGYHVIEVAKGKCILNGGTIQSSTAGQTVIVATEGKFVMNGGEIENDGVSRTISGSTYDPAALNVCGGTATINAGTLYCENKYAVSVTTVASTVNIHGGDFVANTNGEYCIYAKSSDVPHVINIDNTVSEPYFVGGDSEYPYGMAAFYKKASEYYVKAGYFSSSNLPDTFVAEGFKRVEASELKPIKGRLYTFMMKVVSYE